MNPDYSAADADRGDTDDGAALEPAPGPFAKLDPKDGYQVEVVTHGGEISVHLVCYQGGELCNLWDAAPEDATLEIGAWSLDDPQARGQASRLSEVWLAINRYFLAGGDWEELERSQAKAKMLIQGGCSFQGYHYEAGFVRDDGIYQHIFAADDGSDEAAMWVEDEYIGPVSLKDFQEV